jgi:hypothetical protein
LLLYIDIELSYPHMRIQAKHVWIELWSSEDAHFTATSFLCWKVLCLCYTIKWSDTGKYLSGVL